MSIDYKVTVGFPIKFTDDCDLELEYNEVSDHSDLKMAVFIQNMGIPLYEFGSKLNRLIFDPLDFPTEVLVADSIASSVLIGNESLVIEDDNIQFFVDNTKLSVVVPYFNMKTGKDSLVITNVNIP